MQSLDITIKSKFAQFKIQQMAFMIIAVFIFFTLVGLFFLQLSLGGIKSSAQQLEREQMIASLISLTGLPEVSCSDKTSNCVDEDKIYILGDEAYNQIYKDFWPIAEIRVYRINSNFSDYGEIKCPQSNCNYYEVYDSGQKAVQRQSTYVSICRTSRKDKSVFQECELGLLSIGMKIID